MRRRALRAPQAVAVVAALAAMAGAERPASGAAEVRIAALVSQDAAPYEEALAGFKGSLERQGTMTALEVYRLHGDPAAPAAALQDARQKHAQILFTLGAIATQAAIRQVSDVPIVAGMVLSADDLGRVPNVTGVVLEFPVETEFRWLQRLLPGQRNVGVLFCPAENQARVAAAEKAARAAGLTLYARKVDSPRDLPDALDSLSNRADVLWGLADQVVLNPQTVQSILLFSLRNRIPFVGLSQTWVKAGALYALDRDYADIGTQCGELAGRILQGAAPSSLPPVPPRKVLYAINLKTAKLLKLDIQESVVHGAQAVFN